jgi:hypothetical protein
MTICTAGMPAEYGRKMGGVIELNTELKTEQETQPGFHGEVVLSAGYELDATPRDRLRFNIRHQPARYEVPNEQVQQDPQLLPELGETAPPPDTPGQLQTAGADLYHSERLRLKIQADGENLTDVLDVLDLGGLFSGNAIGPSRNLMLRLSASF